MTRLVAALLFLGLALPAHAQLAEPGDKERYVGLFFLKPTEADWVGAVSSRGTWTRPATSTPPLRWDMSWQFDYGSFGVKRVTPTAAAPGRETDASRNAGTYALNVWNGRVTRFVDWRWEATAGLEHKRVQDAVDANTRHVNGAIARVAGVVSSSKAILVDKDVCGGPSAVAAAQLDFRVVGALTTAKAVTATGDRQEKFADAIGEAWFSMWPTFDEGDCRAEPAPWHRVVISASAIASNGLGDVDSSSSADASVTFYATQKIGVRLRRFAGHFDHNLRDRKSATTALIVVRF